VWDKEREMKRQTGWTTYSKKNKKERKKNSERQTDTQNHFSFHFQCDKLKYGKTEWYIYGQRDTGRDKGKERRKYKKKQRQKYRNTKIVKEKARYKERKTDRQTATFVPLILFSQRLKYQKDIKAKT
jgi:hypothetical protein